MTQVYVEQYALVGRDGTTRIQIVGQMLDGGAAVLDADSAGAGDTVALLPACSYIRLRSVGDSYAGFTSDPEDLEDGEALQETRYDLAEEEIRYIQKKNGATHLSVILKDNA